MEVGTGSKVRRAVRHMNPAHAVRTLLTRRVVQKVTSRYGLVYFGRIDHTEDGAAIVRGHTVSPSQIDNHYAVGTIQGYDVTFVQRNSLALMLDKSELRCHWLIVSIKLHADVSIPHIYIGPSGDDKMFQASYTQLKPLSLGNTAPYPQKFTSNYSVYGRPSDTLDIEWLLPPSSCIVVADYFSAMPFEIEDNTLYIYNENQHPTGAVIDKMLENGVWLAKAVDALAGTKE